MDSEHSSLVSGIKLHDFSYGQYNLHAIAGAFEGNDSHTRKVSIASF